ncbi:hypothetical protein ATCC90586_004659 [Pythium insidiosum]|nr:hypothetical protein ATCC90586_004659 [Pythium insidiosum]
MNAAVAPTPPLLSRVARQRCVVAISRRAFRVIWALAMALHAVGAAFHVAMLLLHEYLYREELNSFLGYLGDGLYRFFPTIITLNAVFAGLHALTFAGTLASSFYQRELTFHFTSRMALATPEDLAGGTLSSSATSKHASQPPAQRWLASFQLHSRELAGRVNSRTVGWRPVRWARRLYRVGTLLLYLLFSRRGLFGMESRYFPQVFALREAVEIVFQTYQALRLSRHVSTVWINRLLSLVIVANCWATPIVRLLFRRDRQESQRRLACLVLDLALDVTSVFVIPLTVFWPYARSFRADYLDFPFLNYYDDTWFVRAVAENQQLFVMSSFDLMTKALPWLTLISTLRSIKATFRLLPDTDVLPAAVKARAVHAEEHQRSPAASPSSPPPPPAYRRQSSGRTLSSPAHTPLHRVMDALMVLWGVAVGGLHFHASAVATLVHSNTGCLLEVRPWFSSDYNCAVLEVHCEAWRLRGVHDLETVLAPLAPARLQSLIFSSCRDLVMPRRLRRFPRLQVLKLFNVTLRAWDATAALTADAHPTIQLLYLVDVNMTGIPEGLRTQPFPPTLQDIELCGTNLTALPTDLDVIWGGEERYLDYFVLENVYGDGLQHVPELLETLHVRHLSLCATDIAALPESFFWGNSSLELFDVSSNPRLREIPERRDLVEEEASSGADPADVLESRRTPLWELHVQFTAVATLPAWIAVAEPASPDWTDTQLVVYAERSPLCDGGASALPELSAAVAVDCAHLPPNATRRLLYPLESELLWRAASAARWLQHND